MSFLLLPENSHFNWYSLERTWLRTQTEQLQLPCSHTLAFYLRPPALSQ